MDTMMISMIDGNISGKRSQQQESINQKNNILAKIEEHKKQIEELYRLTHTYDDTINTLTKDIALLEERKKQIEEENRKEAERKEAERNEAERQEMLRKYRIQQQEAIRQEELRKEAKRQEDERFYQEELRKEAERREAMERLRQQHRAEAERREAERQEALRQQQSKQPKITQIRSSTHGRLGDAIRSLNIPEHIKQQHLQWIDGTDNNDNAKREYNHDGKKYILENHRNLELFQHKCYVTLTIIE